MATDAKALTESYIAQLKSAKQSRIDEEYDKVRNTKVIPQQNEIEQARVKLVNAYGTQHTKRLEDLRASYDSMVKAENDSYMKNIADAQSKAESDKAAIEANIKDEISKATAADYDAAIDAAQKLIS